jgi:dTDP-4-dehydrorhamnose 3,5-epimerase
VQIRELSVPDSYEITPKQFADDRGIFLEWYRFDRLEQVVGHSLNLRQANTSVSQRGVVRGIHYSDVPPGQGKYVTVTHGAGIDFVVDIREGSPTFGQWDSVVLDTIDRRAVYVAEGLGHAFIALTDDATLTYLVSDIYKPNVEHDINVLDPQIGLVFPPELGDLVLSPKDKEAPTLAQRLADGSLPSYKVLTAYYESIRKENS